MKLESLPRRDGFEPTAIFTYGCDQCKTLIAHGEHIISDRYRASRGKGFLMHQVRNVKLAKESEDLPMTTGINTVQLINCQICDNRLGWKYIAVPTPEQNHKIGKYLVDSGALTQL